MNLFNDFEPTWIDWVAVAIAAILLMVAR